MRRVLATSGAAALVLLIGPTAAFAIRPFSSDINAGQKRVELISDYTAPDSSTTTITEGPAGGGAASAGGGASSSDTAKSTSSAPAADPPPPSVLDVIGALDSRSACGAGVPLRNCQSQTPAPAQQQQTQQVTTTVTRQEVFEKAVDQITLTPPDLGASPCLADPSNCMGTVGAPVWLWVEDGGELPSGTAKAEAGPFSVKAKAEVHRVKWSLGDGQSTVCEGAGTVFDADVHGWSTPDCGFETGWKQAGTYTLTATYQWKVSWSGDVNGAITRDLSSSQDITVREIQAVVDGHSA